MGICICALKPFTVVAATQETYHNITAEKEYISSRKAIIGWRYKIVDGTLFKRQYNYTTQQWIGKWEPCY